MTTSHWYYLQSIPKQIAKCSLNYNELPVNADLEKIIIFARLILK